ncbi:MAG: hypothetical protein ACOX88_03140 [Christensenellales bacterium]|jgi:hypothetical protein
MVQIIITLVYVALVIDFVFKLRNRDRKQSENLLYGGLLLISYTLLMLAFSGVPLPSPIEPIEQIIYQLTR